SRGLRDVYVYTAKRLTSTPRSAMRYVLALIAVVAVAQFAGAQPAGEDKPMLVVETGGHSASITQLLFTPKSKAMITVSIDKTIGVWDVATGALQRTI